MITIFSFFVLKSLFLVFICFCLLQYSVEHLPVLSQENRGTSLWWHHSHDVIGRKVIIFVLCVLCTNTLNFPFRIIPFCPYSTEFVLSVLHTRYLSFLTLLPRISSLCPTYSIFVLSVLITQNFFFLSYLLDICTSVLNLPRIISFCP